MDLYHLGRRRGKEENGASSSLVGVEGGRREGNATAHRPFQPLLGRNRPQSHPK